LTGEPVQVASFLFLGGVMANLTNLTKKKLLEEFEKNGQHVSNACKSIGINSRESPGSKLTFRPEIES
jgi:hypothetical protein